MVCSLKRHPGDDIMGLPVWSNRGKITFSNTYQMKKTSQKIIFSFVGKYSEVLLLYIFFIITVKRDGNHKVLAQRKMM